MKDKTITAIIISAGVAVLSYGFYGKNFAALLLLTAAFLLAALIRYENIRSVGVVTVATLLSLAMAELVVAWVVPAKKVLTSYDRGSDYSKIGYGGSLVLENYLTRELRQQKTIVRRRRNIQCKIFDR